MTIAMQPIYTQTVGAGGTTVISFNNIPQTFTDIQMVISARTNGTGGTRLIGAYLSGNGYPSNSTFTNIVGTGSATASDRSSTYSNFGLVTDSTHTANTFASTSIYIPNYTNTSYFKQFIIDSVQENNATTARQYLAANLWRYTSAITSIAMDCGGEVFQPNSTFTLYGITKG